jgi:type I restriction enzyme S subunit
VLAERRAARVEELVLGKSELSGQRAVASELFDSRPARWEETAIRHLGIDVQTGPFGSQLHAEDYVTGGIPVINPMHLIDGHIVPSDVMTISESKRQDLELHVLVEGDIVLARRGELGRLALVDDSGAGYLCGTGSMRLRSRDSKMRPGYLSMLLSSRPLRSYFTFASVGSTMDNLSAEIVLGAPVLVPPEAEQRRIESEVDAIRAVCDSTLSSISRQVSLLLERRQALITAAVTGELQIPGVAA